MPAKRGTTQQVNWRVATEALELLAKLEPLPHRRGQFVSNLIRAAAEQAGLIEAPRPTVEDRITALEQELAQLKAEIRK